MFSLILGCLTEAGEPVVATPVAAPAAEQAKLTVKDAFTPPSGFSRVEVPPDSFKAYVRELALYPPDRKVLDYQGNVMAMPAVRVVDMPVGNRDLQQCADSILRIRAEWERKVGKSPAFHYTSGDLSSWSDWSAGTRLKVSGNTVSRVAKAAAPDASDASFERWLFALFMYAGTRSLPLDTVAATLPVQPGDLLVTPGSPGHAVLVLDVAVGEGGTKLLIGQGFMPAMDFHVVEAPEGGAWFTMAGEVLETRPIAMSWAGHRRFKE
jgi:hypothetical protein